MRSFVLVPTGRRRDRVGRLRFVFRSTHREGRGGEKGRRET